MTDVTFTEDADSGEGLFCTFTFERVTFASLQKVAVPQDIVNSLKKKAAPVSNKGKVDSTPQTKTETNGPKTDIDPRRNV